MKFYLIFKYSDFSGPRDYIEISDFDSLPSCIDWCREFLRTHEIMNICVYSADDGNKFFCRVRKTIDVDYSF